jgi:MFS family permease
VSDVQTLPAQSAPPKSRLEAVDYPGRWRALPVLLVATFMALFDLFVVNVAAPSIGTELHSGTAAIELVIGGYSFTYAAGLVTGGRLGDLYGHRKLFVAGMTAFALASLLCGLAQSPSQLVIARLLQGATASLMVPQVLAVITAVFPVQERAKALGWFGLTVGVGSVSGQILGGALLDWDLFGLGWRAIFLVNLPIGLIAAALAWRILPVTRGAVAYKIDLLGVLGTSVTVGLALVPLVLGHSEGWPVWGWVLLALSVPTGFATLRHQQHLATTGGHPLLDLTLFRHRAFTSGVLVNISFFAGFSGFLLAMTLALQSGLGLSPLHAGLTFAPLGVAFATAAMLSRGLVARYGSLVVTAGATISGIGLAILLGSLIISGGDVASHDHRGNRQRPDHPHPDRRRTVRRRPGAWWRGRRDAGHGAAVLRRGRRGRAGRTVLRRAGQRQHPGRLRQGARVGGGRRPRAGAGGAGDVGAAPSARPHLIPATDAPQLVTASWGASRVCGYSGVPDSERTRWVPCATSDVSSMESSCLTSTRAACQLEK